MSNRGADRLELINAAGINAAKGSWRKSADAYKAAYSAKEGYHKDKPYTYAFNCISGYSSIFQEEGTPPLETDFIFLKQISKDNEAITIIRAEAMFAYGFMSWQISNRERAARYYRKAINLIEQSVSIPNEKVMFPANGEYKPKSTAPLLQEKLNICRENLAILEGHRYGSIDSRSLGKVMKDIVTPVPGATCDVCHITSTKLNKCAACGNAWYCSKSCQKVAWPDHKLECRKMKLKEVNPSNEKEADHINSISSADNNNNKDHNDEDSNTNTFKEHDKAILKDLKSKPETQWHDGHNLASYRE